MAPSTLSFSTRSVGGVTVIDISGRLTLGPALAALNDSVMSLLASGFNKILLNLAEVAYVDSAGIGQLTGCLKAVASAGGSLKLVRVTPRVEGLLKLTHIHSLFGIYADEEKAIAAFD